MTEEHSGAARREILRHDSVPWTPLHEIEVRNALRLIHGRGQIDENELVALASHIDEDLSEGRLVRPAIDLDAVFRRAGALSERHAAETLARALDILHVAASLELGCALLVSGDDRQLTLAESERLTVADIRVRP